MTGLTPERRFVFTVMSLVLFSQILGTALGQDARDCQGPDNALPGDQLRRKKGSQSAIAAKNSGTMGGTPSNCWEQMPFF